MGLAESKLYKLNILITLVVGVVAIAHADARLASHGQWSRNSQVIYQDLEVPIGVMPSPDGKSEIMGSAHGLSLVKSEGVPVDLKIAVTPALTEGRWSADSKSFFINDSDGGAVGTWDTWIFQPVKGGGVQSFPVRNLIEQRIPHFMKCEAGEVLNIASIGWLDGGDKVLMVAQVPDHSACSNMGAEMYFVYSIENNEISKKMSKYKFKH